MSTALAFDTLKFATRLEDAGAPPAQAKAQAQVLREVFDERDQAMASVQAMLHEARRDAQYSASKSEQFSTKTDIHDLKATLATKTELAAVKAEMATKTDLEAVKAEMATKTELAVVKADLAEVKVDLTVVKTDLSGVKIDLALLRKDFEAMEQRLNARMDALQNKLLIKLSLVMVGLTGLMVTAQRLSS